MKNKFFPLTREEINSMSLGEIIYTCLHRAKHPKDIKYWRKQVKRMERTKKKLEKNALRRLGEGARKT